MQVWELHRDLANSIGDSCQITSTAIPDGVRFPRELRDSYLYRAMLDIIARTVKVATQMPYKIASEMIERLFPNMIKENTATINYSSMGNGSAYFANFSDVLINGYTGVAWLLNARIYPNTNLGIIGGHSYPLPIKRGSKINELVNDRNVQVPDTFATWMHTDGVLNDILHIWDRSIDVQSMQLNQPLVAIRYLPYPIKTVDYSGPNSIYQPSLTKEVNFEPAYYPNVLALASLYAMTDGQDIENIDRYLPMQLGFQRRPIMPIAGINNTPNIPGGVGIRPLSKYWTHQQIASEAMVLTNTIDNENIQLDNVRNHINAGISYLAGLLNLAASPWYGIYATFCFEPVLHHSGLEYLDLTDSVNNRVNDISNMLFSIDRINMRPFTNPNALGPSSSWNGNVIKEDIAQLTQLNTQQNIQWRHSVAWAHHGQDLLFYVGNNIQTANRPVPAQTDYTLFCNTGLGGGQMFTSHVFTFDWANPLLYTTIVNGNSVTITYIGSFGTNIFEHSSQGRTGIQLAIALNGLTDNTGIDKIYLNSIFPALVPPSIVFSGTLNTLTLTFSTGLPDGNYSFLWTNGLTEMKGGVNFSIITSVASYNNFVLWAYRLPLLDNLIAPAVSINQNPLQNYFTVVDLPDRYVDLLIKIVMQKILAQIREQVPMQLEAEINQGVATITGMLNAELQFEAAEREKRKYGAQQKAPGAVG